MKKRIIATALAALTACSCMGVLSACGGDKGASEGTLTVRYYNGGYGDEWLEEALKDFCATKEGVTYNMIPDNNITYQANLYLKNNVPDIIMSNGNWKDYVQDDLVEDLTSVYETEVQTSQGAKKIKDYVDQNVMKQFTRQKQYGRGEALTWGMPWASQVLSLAYNETILLSTAHQDGNPFIVEGLEAGATWTHEPYTVNELMAYLYDVREADNGIIPWGYSVDYLNWYDALFYVWWAQIQGTMTPNKYVDEGCFYDFFNMTSADLVKQSGYKDALEIVRKIIVDENGKLYNSNNDGSMTKEKMQENFAKGNIAICLVGDFFEKEYKAFMKEGNVFKLMFIPTADDAETNADGTAKKLTYVQTDNVMYVPKNATNKDLAKEFLAFLCSEEQLMQFTKNTGVVRPFNYNAYELEPTYSWTDFQKSTFNIYYNADDFVIKYPLTATKISPIYLYEEVSMFMGLELSTVFGELRSKPVDGAADRIVNRVYTSLKKSFDEWNEYYGLEG